MKIDLDKLDKITPIEDKIEKTIIANKKITNLQQLGTTKEEQVLYILTIITILYKEKHNIINTAEKSKKIDQELTQELMDHVAIINEIINQLNTLLRKKQLFQCILTIEAYEEIISSTIEMYNDKKNTNYILKKSTYDSINKTQKQLLKLNPFAINQLMKYENNKLTEEEKIIADILEFGRIAQIKLDDLIEKMDEIEYQKEMQDLVKKQILINYNEPTQKNVILFMIGNIYQEMKENSEERLNLKITSIIENDEMNNDKLIILFKKSDNFSRIVIGKFIEYNLEIKEGRLEELKTKPSYQMIKNKNL